MEKTSSFWYNYLGNELLYPSVPNKETLNDSIKEPEPPKEKIRQKSHTSSYVVVGNFTFISFNIISFKIAGLQNTNIRSISPIDPGLKISALTPRDVVKSYIIDISNNIKRRGH